MSNYLQHSKVSTRQTPQSQAIPGRPDMKRNEAGGWGWDVDKWDQLQRFLILGTEGGTYYVGQQKLTQQNAQAALECIQEDPLRVVRTVVEVSQQGRAPKNDPALFVLAMTSVLANDEGRAAAYAALPQVARIGTHLFQFVGYRELFGGWGRGMVRAVANWYNLQNLDRLAYQMIKYQQREGWSHADLLRLAHIRPQTPAQTALYRWAEQGDEAYVQEVTPEIVGTYIQAKTYKHAYQWISLLEEHPHFPREALPTEALKYATVWQALVKAEMPIHALLRNLGNLSKHGLLRSIDSVLYKQILVRLEDGDRLVKDRVHPMNLFKTLKVYASGGGYRSQSKWNPNVRLVDALEAAFHKTFRNVQPIDAHLTIGVDVSGSMGVPAGGFEFIRCSEAAAAMALVLANAARDYEFVAFDTGKQNFPFTAKSNLRDLTNGLPWGGGTDVAVPIKEATKAKLQTDAFVILSDSQTWAGERHVMQALAEYRRQRSNPNAKLVVANMAATRTTVADPQDKDSLNIAGFDTNLVEVIGAFLKLGGEHADPTDGMAEESESD